MLRGARTRAAGHVNTLVTLVRRLLRTSLLAMVVLIGGSVLGAMPALAQTYTISGTIFEDVNYGGGPGRPTSTATGWQPASNGSSRATVELYDASGNFLATTQAAANGTYSFTNRSAGSYQVRLVVQTAPSSRTGWVNTLRPVLTYRTDGSSGAATATGVLDRVGGENPALGDTTANSGSQTIAQLTSANAQPQALAPVTLVSNDVGGVDFGVHFTTVTSTRNAGGGSLRQVITNANTLTGDASLQTAGRAYNTEHVIFMISNGTTGGGGSLNLAAGGLRTANNYLTTSAGTYNVATITPPSGSALPGISSSLVLDAQTQPGWVVTNGPLIEISGASIGTNFVGISVTAGTSIVRGFVINRFTGTNGGLAVTGGTGHTIAGNWIGLNAAGALASANGYGMFVSNATNVTVGGLTAADRNVVSGNTNDGITVNGSSTGAVVQGNYVGLDVAGTTARGNGRYGIYVANTATGALIGGNVAGARNVVAGNTSNGVRIEAANAIVRGNIIGLTVTNQNGVPNAIGVLVNGVAGAIIGDTVASGRNIIAGNTNDGIQFTGAGVTSGTVWGNYIGLDTTGTVARANSRYGVYTVSNATGITIGGRSGGMRNVIAGNTSTGVRLESPNNIVRGNIVGLTVTNATGQGNAGGGVYVVGTAGAVIGDTIAAGRNIISGNTNDGIQFNGAGVTSGTVWGNYIGLDTTGTVARANTRYGVYTLSNATGITIGGRSGGMRNVIAGNTGTGVRIESPNNIVRGNIVGLTVTNASGQGNAGGGVYVVGAAGAVIGDTLAAGRNIISGNTNDGIQFNGAGVTSGTVWGNYIGLDTTGTVARANTRYGVYTTSSSTGITIGGRISGSRNIISGNTSNGIRLESANNIVRGNIIGLSATNASGVGNTVGVHVNGFSGNVIGDTLSSGRNIISGNTSPGVVLVGAVTSARIWGNYIGTDTTGTAARANTSVGVNVQTGVTGASIGDTISGAPNLIAYNSGAGVTVDANASGVRIRRNRIIGNGGLGIDHGVTASSDGVTLNDGAKPSTAGNSGMDTPVFTSVSVSGSTLTVAGYIGNAPGQSLFGSSRVEVFVADPDPTNYGEAQDFIGGITVDASGMFSGTITIPGGVTVTDLATQITGTATDASGNTSEFSRNITVGAATGTGSITGMVFEDINYGGGAGRPMSSATGWQPASNGTSRATVELYDGNGTFRAVTNAAPDGSYGFFGLTAGAYKVRLVTYTTPSSRTGWVNTLRPVLTFRTDASGGFPVNLTDRVGGENPLLPDTLANTGAQTLAQLTTANAQPQAVTDVQVGAGTVSGVDFGVNFSTITRTANTGQGTLRQFITNANAMAGQASLAQAGQRMRLGSAEALPSGVETSIFMIPGGETRPGLRASVASQLTSGVANITVSTVLPTISRTLVSIDGTTQTVTGGNTNTTVLGAGGVAGVDNLPVPRVEGPEVQINGTRSIDGLVISGGSVQVRGLALRTFSRAIQLTTATSAMIEENILGSIATGLVDPGSATTRNGNNILINGAANNTVIQNNVLAFTATSSLSLGAAASGVIVRGNTFRNASLEATTGDLIGSVSAANASSNWQITGNRMTLSAGTGIDVVGFSASQGLEISNNTISDNGSGNNETVGIVLGGAGSRYTVTRNVITGNRGAGLSISSGVNQVLVSRNVISQNNIGATAGLSAGISLGTPTSNGRRGTDRTVNDGVKDATSGNLAMDSPVFTTASVLPSGKLRVAGYVGSAPNQTTFAGSIVEVFTSDNNTSGVGDGTAFIGTVVADATGAFSDSLLVATGITITPGTTRITGTARDSTNNTSEYGAQIAVSGGSATLAISGTVFEDVNYGGGAGRPRSAATGWAPASNGSNRALLELYDASGNYLARTNAAADGTYTFGTLAPGSYQVRLVVGNTPSSRAGWTSALAPVLTYRTDASNGTPVDVTDRVGGESPNATAAAANTGTQTLATIGTVQALSPVTLTSANVSGVDFGVHFTTVVSTRNSGAGSLRQVLLNADALSGDASLATAGRTAGIEHVIFMMSNGTTGSGGKLNLTGGLRADQTLFTTTGATSNVAGIATGGAAVTLTQPIVIDAQTQPGWTLHPIIQLPSMPITFKGGNSIVRGLIFNTGAYVGVDSVGTTTIQGNWFGLDATGLVKSTTRPINNIYVFGNATVRIGGTTAAERNVFGDASFNNIELTSGSGHVIQGNYLGTTYLGTSPRLPVARNILLSGTATNVLIGGSAPGEGNVISAVEVPSNNTRGAIALLGTHSGVVIRGNRLGVGADGTSSIGGGGFGIYALGTGTIIGGTGAGDANIITNFTGGGVIVGTPTAPATTSVQVSGNSIYGNGATALDLGQDGVTANDGALTTGGANSLMDAPVITSTSISPSGRLVVSGYVGSASGQATFGGSVVELFVSATGAGAPGSGRTYLGSITAAADGTFTDSLTVPASVRSGTTPLTATATLANATSEFATAVNVVGTSAGTLAISGVVFDDVNYGGGPGRTRSEAIGSQPAVNGMARARVELYDESGAFLTNTSVAADGSYTFSGLAAGRYQVRLATRATPSSRSGYDGTVLPVLTFRTDASSGTAQPVRDRVGGEYPLLADAGENDGTRSLASLGGDAIAPQAVTAVTLGATPITGVDFGVAFTAVTNISGTGPGSFRQALVNAAKLGGDASLAQTGRTSGIEHVVFMIPNGTTGGGGKLNLSGGGLRPEFNAFSVTGRSGNVASIRPVTPLDTVSTPVVIDAQTQPGWNATTADPIIEFSGISNTVTGFNGLTITSTGTIVRGLIINRWPNNGVQLSNAGSNIIEGNWVGVDATGLVASANGNYGINTDFNSPNVRVGGPTLAQRNISAGNTGAGISTGSLNTIIQGNWVGLGADGVTRLVNGENGVRAGGTNILIGGTAPGEGNVIASSAQAGIFMQGTGNIVRGNKIGTDTSGTRALGNTGFGISVFGGTGHVIGGTGVGEANIIAYNSSAGVALNNGAVQATISGNSIFGNTGLGLDLLPAGVTANDGVYTTGQANQFIDSPVITSASLLPSGKLLVSGYVGTAAGQTVFTDDRVELFISDNDGTGFGEGRTYLGTVRTVTTTSDFSDSLTVPVGVTLRPGVTFLTATTTDAAGNTSEFGANFRYGTGTLAIRGTVFEDVNYGGGAGRSRTDATGWQPASNGSSRARVELYDDAGTFIQATSAAADGTYAFTGLSAGAYRVRLSTRTAPSSRTGWVLNTTLPVITYRTDASTGTPVAVTNAIGGANPNFADATDNTTAQPLTALTTTSTAVQAVAPVVLSAADVTGVDFGVNFSTIVNTNDSGQGSLRQFVVNANALGGKTTLAQVGRTAGFETSIFMLPVTASGYQSATTSWRISLSSVLPAITGARITLDATTQAGAALGDLWAGTPHTLKVELRGSGTGNGLFSSQLADDLTIRGFAIATTGAPVAIGLGTGSRVKVQGNYIGLDVTGAITNGVTRGLAMTGTNELEIGGLGATDGNVINGTSTAINTTTAANVAIRGNFFGTDPTGLSTGGVSRPRGFSAFASTSTFREIRRNIFAGNTLAALSFDPGSVSQPASGQSTWSIAGNYIGVGRDGVTPLPNAQGISTSPDAATVNVTGLVIGGTTASDRNVIAANTGDAIRLRGLTGSVVVRGNYLGVGADGTTARGNGGDGVYVEATNPVDIGGTTAGSGNVIAYNAGRGIAVTTGTAPASIRGNDIYLNGQLGIDLAGDGASANDGTKSGALPNSGMDTPVLTAVAMSPSGKLLVSGYVGSAANQATFANSRVELFLADNDPSGFGEGRRYLGAITADGQAMFSDSLDVPIGVTLRGGINAIAATATDAAGNTSEFGPRLTLSGGGSGVIAGTVFEDLNYGGGAGRPRSSATGWAPASTSTARALLELYDDTGTFLTSTTTAADGSYTFSGLSAGNYQVRLLTGSTPSSRPGYSALQVPVLTYRVNASSGTAVGVTDRVGGEVPSLIDAASNSGAQLLSALTTGSTTAQAVAPVSVSGGTVSGVDFGVNFSTIVSTRDAGQGTLRQFLINTNALGNKAQLAQAGSRLAVSGGTEALPAGVETSIFMIPAGTSVPGLRSSVASALTSGVAVFTPATLYPTVTSSRTAVDGTTQTVNVGNTNARMLGSGGTVGVSQVALAQIPGPEVQITGTSAITSGLFFNNASTTQVRGLSVWGFGSGITARSGPVIFLGGDGISVELNVLGATATSIADPRTTGVDQYANSLVTFFTTNIAVRNNIVGYGGRGLMIEQFTGATITGNEVLGPMQFRMAEFWVGRDALFRGNLVRSTGPTSSPAQYAVFASNTVSQIRIEENTIEGNAVTDAVALGNAGTNTLLSVTGNVIRTNTGPAITVYSGASMTLSRNAMSGNTRGVDLGGDGFTQNDGLRIAGTPNQQTDTPVLTSASLTGSTLTVSGYVGQFPNQATFANSTVELFADVGTISTTSGQGATYLGTITSGSTGSFSGSVTLPVGVSITPALTWLTATSTDVSGNTSEFGPNLLLGPWADVATTLSGPVTGTAGIAQTYTVKVKNTGIYAASGAQPQVTVPAGVTVRSVANGGSVASGVITWPAATIAVGDSILRTFDALANADGVYTFAARSTATTADPDSTNNNGSRSNARVATVLGAGADVILASRTVRTVAVGVPATLVRSIRNAGAVAVAGDLELTDSLPTGLTFTSATGTGWTCTPTGRLVNCRRGALPAGDSTLVSITAAVDTSAIPSAVVVSSLFAPGDVDSLSNRVTDSLRVSTGIDVLVRASGVPLSVGEERTLRLVAQNIGTAPTTSPITLGDSLPASLEFRRATGANWNCSGVGRAFSCTRSTPLVAGDSGVVALTVFTLPGAPTRITAPFRVRTTGDTNAANDTTSLDLGIGSLADVVASLRGPAAAVAGVTSPRYTVTVKNRGPSPASDVVARVTVPTNVTVDSISDGGTLTNNIITWPTLASISAADSVTRTFVTRTSTLGSYRYSVASTSSTFDDSLPNNDGSVASAQVTTAVSAGADLAMRALAVSPLAVGRDATVSMTIANIGTGPTVGPITITDTLPAGLTFKSAATTRGFTCTATGAVLWCTTTESLAARDSLTLPITVGVLPAAFPRLALRTRVNTLGDTNASNDSTALTVAVSAVGDVVTTLTGPATLLAGTTSSRFTVRVQNRGPAPSADVVARVTLPANVTADSISDGGTVSASTITWPAITTLASSDSVARTFVVRSSTPGSYRYSAASTATTSDDSLPNNDGSLPTAQVTTVVTSGVDLAIKAAGPTELIVGRDGLVTLTLTNVGVGPSIGPITVTDTLPTGITFKSTSNTRFTCTARSNVLGCTTSDTLAARDSLALPLTFNVLPAAVPSVTLRHRVSTNGDVAAANDTTSQTITVRGDFAIFADVTAAKASAEIGDPVDYTGSVKIVGQSPVPGVTYRLRLPRGFVYQPGTLTVDGAPAQSVTARIAQSRGTTAAPTVTLGGVLLRDDPIATADGAFDVPLGDLPAGATVSLRWRLRLGPGAQRGDGRVTAQAVSSVVKSASNTAKAQVKVQGGVFTDRGIIFGKVFVDCACDSSTTAIAEAHEVGVPGVRILLEDGTSVITDAEGKYSMPGLAPRLHVVRIDPSTLPEGSRLLLTGNRNVGNAESRLVDLTNGEFQKANFAIARAPQVLDVVRARRRANPGATTEATPLGFASRGTGLTDVRLGVSPAAPDGPTVLAASRGLTDSAGVVIGRAITSADSTPRFGSRDSARTAATGMLTWVPKRFIATGLLQGRLELRNFGGSGSRLSDGFDAALRGLARSSRDSSFRMGARSAFYASGDIARETRLTLAFDSERERDQDLMRDIDPENEYAVFGDASIREFDARSAGGLTRNSGRGFARLDRGRSTVLLGDFTAPSSDDARRLSAYDRTMTGLREHIEVGTTARGATVDGFVSRTSLAQRVEELQGQGISGPYQLSRADVKQNSEQVELIVRDRNQPALVLSRTTLGRFTDYTLERDAGRLLFRAPVPSVDANLNPVSVRVAYEVETGGEPYLAYGADARVRSNGAMLGVAAVRDENPMAPRDVMGVHGAVTFGGTTLLAEVARTDGAAVSATTGATLETTGPRTTGDAGRVELRRQGGRVNFQLSGAITSRGFANPSALQPAGRTEVGGNGSVTLTPHTRLLLQMLRTEDRLTGGRRDGALVSVEQQFWNRVRVELGYRWAEENKSPVRSDSTFAAPTLQPSSLAALRTKTTVDLLRGPRFRSSIAGEFEQDIREAGQRRAAVSGDIGMARGARLYARHEFLRAAGGPFALGSAQSQSATVIGLTADVRTSQQVFNEYRLRDGMSGRQAEAAFGLRNRWRVDSGVVLNTSFERVAPVGDTTSRNRTTALTGGVEFTRWAGTRATARAEFRRVPGGDSWLTSAALAQQVTRGVTFLGRTVYTTSPTQDRLRAQLGLALRPVDSDVWNALVRVDERRESTSPVGQPSLTSAGRVLSLHVNTQPAPRWGISSRYAFKRGLEDVVIANAVERGRTITQLLATRALYDLTPLWDVALQGSLLGDASFGTRQTGLGASVGRRVLRDLRVAAGYNLFGWTDVDLAGSGASARGFVIDFGFKFDESTLRRP